ncbi:MAG: type II secretion system F family protein [Planctomycetota bacterium]
MLLDLCWQRGIALDGSEKVALEVAWRSGKAGHCLRQRATARRTRSEFSRKLWSGLRYPLVLLIGIAVTAVCCSGIIGPGYAIGIGIAYALLAALTFALVRGIRRGHPLVERIPGVPTLMADLRELPYLDAMQMLYGAGVPIVEAHEAALRTTQAPGLRQDLRESLTALQAGNSYADALALPEALTQESRVLLANGEQAGQLEEALLRAHARRREVAQRKLILTARTVGNVVYAAAVVGVVLLAYTFYTSLYAGLASMRR